MSKPVTIAEIQQATRRRSRGRALGVPLPEQWYDTGLGGCCAACFKAGYVLDGHFACSAEGLASETELLDLTNGVDETQSELVDGAWRLIAFAHPDVAEERGWVLAD